MRWLVCFYDEDGARCVREFKTRDEMLTFCEQLRSKAAPIICVWAEPKGAK